LQTAAPDVELTWIGTVGGMEAEIVGRAGIPFLAIPGGGVHGVALLNAVRNGWELARGAWVARRAMLRERPNAMFTTGGYVSGPVALAARWLRVPILVFLPDIEPAQSVKAVGRWAARIATTVEDSRQFFPAEKVVVTGYPLGERITRWTRSTARKTLGLDETETVLLVFGGSRGARSINRALMPHIAELTDLCHILHISGTLDWPEIEAARDRLPEHVKARYQAHAYLHEEMGAAMAAADLVVCRAGASVLGEFPYFGLPSILVPYPHAWRYQRVNAAWLEERGAAIVIEDADLARDIAPTVRDLLAKPERRNAISAAARKLARPDAAQKLAELLQKLGQGG